MEFQAFPQILIAVIMVLGGQKGFEFYKRKKYLNGNGERRRDSFSDLDKNFLRSCFEDQTEKMSLAMKTDRLLLLRDIESSVRTEGENTRGVVRAQNA